ncbi:MAG: hypothetical protein FJZ08_05300, partial [Candidatus Omnitrophica bacterium]|nr:hypothetical protein [Candidatus Omnitrophota bacterium]
MVRSISLRYLKLSLFFTLFIFCVFTLAFAYCDTMDGPVVADAKIALEKSDITPALKWIKKEAEPELKTTFDKAITESSKGEQEKIKADAEFFDTLVRLHRQGEGFNFSGVKPAGTDLGPAVTGADKALENGSVDSLVQLLTEEVNKGVRERFNNAFEKKKRAEENTEAGRAFVQAYIEFVHYVE